MLAPDERGQERLIRHIEEDGEDADSERDDIEHADMERKIVEAAGMHYVQVPMRGLAAPNDEQIGTVFKLLSDSSSWPAFVHCKRGAAGVIFLFFTVARDERAGSLGGGNQL